VQSFFTLKAALEGQQVLRKSLSLMFKEAGSDTSKVINVVKPIVQSKRTWTLEQAFDKTMASVWRSPAIRKASRSNSVDIFKFFGHDTPVTAITAGQISDFVSWLRNRGNKILTGGTINNKLATLSRVLGTACEYDQLPVKPRLPKRCKTEGQLRFLSRDEEQALLAAMAKVATPDHVEATIVYLDTGFRISELFQVTVRDVGLAERTITVWLKRPRTVSMTERVTELLARRIEGKNPTDHLFPHQIGWYRTAWSRARKEMGLEGDSQFVPRVLRHTCCSRLIKGGVPLIRIQTWMGHTNVATTTRYAHLAPEDLSPLAFVLESADARWSAL